MSEELQKILTLDELEIKSQELREQGKSIVLCHGTFDLMHTGHIRHLQNAKKEGDILFVTITADQHVNKGPGRPIFPGHLREENLQALACVDFVATNHAPTAIEVLSKIKPQVYVKGNEYENTSNDVTGNIILEKKAVEENGGKIVFTNDIVFSSTNLLNEHFGIFPNETKEYLRKIATNYSDSDVIKLLDSLKNLNILVIGDAIIDEYHYTSPLGQAAKGSHISVKYESMEQFAGGSLAVANHIAGFAKSVTLVAGLGTGGNHEEFIRSKLKKNVVPQFYYFDDSPTIVKRRFVDQDLLKLFEVYFFSEEPSFKNLDKAVCLWLEQNIETYDAVFAPDFGNGFISLAMIDVLCAKACFLAVNTQVNSGNRGYHAITRYPRADFISLNEPELRMAAHNRHDPLESLAEKLAQQTQAKHFAITRGTKGALLLDKKKDVWHNAPVLSTKVLDRVGAGDSFLSLAGLSLCGGLKSELAMFVGSAAAALGVQIVCNRETMEPANLYKYISTLLK